MPEAMLSSAVLVKRENKIAPVLLARALVWLTCCSIPSAGVRASLRMFKTSNRKLSGAPKSSPVRPLAEAKSPVEFRAWQRKALSQDTFREWADRPAKLLSDEQMRQFVVDGFVQIDCGVSSETHSSIYRKMTELLDDPEQSPSFGNNPGNNVIAMIPEIRRVVESPALRGALTSVLGPGYHEHAHRYLHDLRPRSRGGAQNPQPYHKDNQSPVARPATHHPNWAMVLYYPQDTPPILGPTGAMPGSQYEPVAPHMVRDERGLGRPMSGRAGTCTVIHFDLVHRGQINLHKSKTRFMLKLVFQRTMMPTSPSWDCKDRAFKLPKRVLSPYRAETLWAHIWNWMCGNLAEVPKIDQKNAESSETIARMIGNMLQDHQTTRKGAPSPLQYAYQLAALAAVNKAIIPALINALVESKHDFDRAWLTFDTVTIMHPSAHALGAIGATAVQPLLSALRGQTESAAKYAASLDSASSSDSKAAETKRRRALPDTALRFVLEQDSGGAQKLREASGEKRYLYVDHAHAQGDTEWGASGLVVLSRSQATIFQCVAQEGPGDLYALQMQDGRRIHENGMGDCMLRSFNSSDDFTIFIRIPLGNGEFALRVKGSGHVLVEDEKSIVVGAEGDADPRDAGAWVRANLIYALWQMGANARSALPFLLDLLEKERHPKVIRLLVECVGDIAASGAAFYEVKLRNEAASQDAPVATDAVAIMGMPPGETARVAVALGRLLTRDDTANWSRDVHRLFTSNDQVRIAAAGGLMKLGTAAAPAEKDLAHALSDPCGYVQWLASEALVRIGTPTAMRAALRAYRGRWFDATITPEFTF